jgi:CBS domain containing-hemolysin-like protein
VQELLTLLFLLLLSGVFSGSETALVSISLARAEALNHEGRRGAAALYRLKGTLQNSPFPAVPG